MTTREAIRRALIAPCNLNLQPFLQATENKVSRPAWSRLNATLDALMNGERFTAKSFAARFGTCTKSIHRDIDYLRGRGFKVFFNYQLNSFSLNKPEAAQ